MITTASLNNLLKNSKCIDYLFKYPLENGNCLFSQIACDETGRQALSACNPALLKSLSLSRELAEIFINTPLLYVLAATRFRAIPV